MLSALNSGVPLDALLCYRTFTAECRQSAGVDGDWSGLTSLAEEALRMHRTLQTRAARQADRTGISEPKHSGIRMPARTVVICWAAGLATLGFVALRVVQPGSSTGIRHSEISRTPPLVAAGGVDRQLADAAHKLLQKGWGEYQAAQYSESRSTMETARGLFLRAKDQAGLASADVELGEAYQAQGQTALSRRLYEEALAIRRQMGPPLSLAHSAQLLGNLLTVQGEYDQAEALLDESLRLRKTNKDPVGVVLCQWDLGKLARERGWLDRSERLLHEAHAGAKREGKPDITAAILADEGVTALEQGNIVLARRLETQSLAYWRQRGYPRWIATVELKLARVALRGGDKTEAKQRAARSQAVYARLGDRAGERQCKLLLNEARSP
jgi:tetratricopeptide (TPR) repeat protein